MRSHVENAWHTVGSQQKHILPLCTGGGHSEETNGKGLCILSSAGQSTAYPRRTEQARGILGIEGGSAQGVG